MKWFIAGMIDGLILWELTMGFIEEPVTRFKFLFLIMAMIVLTKGVSLPYILAISKLWNYVSSVFRKPKNEDKEFENVDVGY